MMRGGSTEMDRHDSGKGMPFDAADLARLHNAPNLPDAAAEQLRLASLAWHDDACAERHLWAAHAAAADHEAVLIGFYRYYFYKTRLSEALNVARRCILEAARDNALDPDWRRVGPDDAEFGHYEAAGPRFYLFSLKAYAYLQLRLGAIAEGRDAAAKLLDLDPTDKVGGRVLLDVIGRMAKGIDDD